MEHFFPSVFLPLGKETEALILGLLKRGRLRGSVGRGTGKRGEEDSELAAQIHTPAASSSAGTGVLASPSSASQSF